MPKQFANFAPYLHKSQYYNKKNGFTLVELLITTTLTVLLMLTITTLFMTFLVGNSKTNIRKAVKEEGLHALNQIEFIIKNAKYFDLSYSACASDLTSIQVVGLDNGITTFSTVTDSGVDKIASNSARLTSNAVNLSNLRFHCSGDLGYRSIRVTFSLDKDSPTLTSDSNISESFEATINMRNY